MPAMPFLEAPSVSPRSRGNLLYWDPHLQGHSVIRCSTISYLSPQAIPKLIKSRMFSANQVDGNFTSQL